MEYDIHGGVNTITGDVEWLEAHGGIFYLNGKVNTIVQHGGIFYDQRPSNRVEYRTDKLSDEERQNYRQKIAELDRKLNQSVRDCLKLREKLGKDATEAPPDDVLVMRIESLEAQIQRERKEHSQKVEDLQERLDVAMEINAKLRRKTTRESNSQQIADAHIDILATLMALYPFTADKDLVFEFGIPADRIRDTARVLGEIKSPEARREAADYLKRQHIAFIERRGGDQGNHTTKIIEKVAKNGRVLKTYNSAKAASRSTGFSDTTIREYCTDYKKKRRYTKNGYTFRYKEK